MADNPDHHSAAGSELQDVLLFAVQKNCETSYIIRTRCRIIEQETPPEKLT